MPNIYINRALQDTISDHRDKMEREGEGDYVPERLVLVDLLSDAATQKYVENGGELP